MTVAIVTLVATLIAAAVAFFSPPEYSASTNIFVATPEVHNPDQADAASKFAQDRAISYRDVIGSESLAARTVTRLRLSESPRDLARKIKATVNPDSVVLRLSVTDSSASSAANLANALSDDFVRMVKDLETPTDGGPPVARAVVLNSATMGVWVAPDRRNIIGFGVLVGLLLGGISALLRGARKPRAQVEDAGPQVHEPQNVGDPVAFAAPTTSQGSRAQHRGDDKALR